MGILWSSGVISLSATATKPKHNAQTSILCKCFGNRLRIHSTNITKCLDIVNMFGDKLMERILVN